MENREEQFKILAKAFQECLQNCALKEPAFAIVDRDNRIVFLDYIIIYAYFSENLREKFDDIFNSTSAYELTKRFVHVINEFEHFQINPDDRFELRWFNIRNYKNIGELNSSHKDTCISVKGFIQDMGLQILQIPKIRVWECNQCGERAHQLCNKYEKLTKFRGVCRCDSINWRLIEVSKYEDVFQFRLEPLPEEISQTTNVPSIICELSHNLANQNFISQFNLGDAYEINGFVKLMEQNNLFPVYNPYIEVTHFKPIVKRHRNISVTEEEKKQIKKFLSKDDSIDNLAKMLGSRVHGFIREKKFFIILKAMQEYFNKHPDSIPNDFLMHMIIIGDYGQGKSELAKCFQDICDNSQYVLGSATTSAGLTGVSTRDDFGQWIITGGVLARANGDTLFVEEFDKQRDKTEFGIINEAMSNFSYVITKGGKNRRFQSNTTFVILGNPIHKSFDLEQEILAQINVMPDLLSRFTVLACVFTKSEIEHKSKVARLMIERESTQFREQDRETSKYIKKCLKVICDHKIQTNTPEIKKFIENYITRSSEIADKLEGKDRQVWEERTQPRSIMNLVKMIRGITLLHLHDEPTEQDMEEALTLYNDFQRDFIQFKEFLTVDEINFGESAQQIEEKYQKYMENTHLKTISVTKRGKLDVLAQLITKDISDIEQIKKRAKDFNITDIEFEEYISLLKQNGDIFEPRAGYLQKL